MADVQLVVDLQPMIAPQSTAALNSSLVQQAMASVMLNVVAANLMVVAMVVAMVAVVMGVGLVAAVVAVPTVMIVVVQSNAVGVAMALDDEHGCSMLKSDVAFWGPTVMDGPPLVVQSSPGKGIGGHNTVG